MAPSTEMWWVVFHEASVLRDRLRKVQRTLTHEQKRDAIRAVKRETWALLRDTHIPHPLKMLVLELLGGYHIAVDDWPIAATAIVYMAMPRR